MQSRMGARSDELLAARETCAPGSGRDLRGAALVTFAGPATAVPRAPPDPASSWSRRQRRRVAESVHAATRCATCSSSASGPPTPPAASPRSRSVAPPTPLQTSTVRAQSCSANAPLHSNQPGYAQPHRQPDRHTGKRGRGRGRQICRGRGSGRERERAAPTQRQAVHRDPVRREADGAWALKPSWDLTLWLHRHLYRDRARGQVDIRRHRPVRPPVRRRDDASPVAHVPAPVLHRRPCHHHHHQPVRKREHKCGTTGKPKRAGRTAAPHTTDHRPTLCSAGLAVRCRRERQRQTAMDTHREAEKEKDRQKERERNREKENRTETATAREGSADKSGRQPWTQREREKKKKGQRTGQRPRQGERAAQREREAPSRCCCCGCCGCCCCGCTHRPRSRRRIAHGGSIAWGGWSRCGA